jgi:hypothetical protein
MASSSGRRVHPIAIPPPLDVERRVSLRSDSREVKATRLRCVLLVAFKHHQATVEEFHATRLPWRKNMEIYEEALELLHA